MRIHVLSLVAACLVPLAALVVLPAAAGAEDGAIRLEAYPLPAAAREALT